MWFSLSLPPLVAILLLAFVWVVVLVLVLWFLLPRGGQIDDAERSEGNETATRRTTRTPAENRRSMGDDTDIPVSSRPRVHTVPTDEARDERPDARNAFEDYDRSGRRRDDLF